ncbi:transposase family protein [Actinomadura nitritigenes]|uniref:transposase family protein n=1 Tax=Actinomadura nitritigenes TaxID=134602 RepID=UPI003D90ECB0
MPPGLSRDLTAACIHGIIDALTSRAIACCADKGYVGAGGAIGTPYKRRKRRRLGKRKKLFNRHHAQVHAPGKQVPTTLKGQRILREACCSPNRLPDRHRPSDPRLPPSSPDA